MEPELQPRDFYWVQWEKQRRYYYASNGKSIARGKIPLHILPHIQEKDPVIQGNITAEKLMKAIRSVNFLEKAFSYPRTDPMLRSLELARQKHQKFLAIYERIPPEVKARLSINPFDPIHHQPPSSRSSSYSTSSSFPSSSSSSSSSFPSSSSYSYSYSSTSSSSSQKPKPKIPPFSSSQKPKPKIPPSSPTVHLFAEEKKLLLSHNIKDRKEWKKWLLQHHPDKNPNVDINLVQRINAAAGRIFISE
jgi:hypothetical protein